MNNSKTLITGIEQHENTAYFTYKMNTLNGFIATMLNNKLTHTERKSRFYT